MYNVWLKVYNRWKSLEFVHTLLLLLSTFESVLYSSLSWRVGKNLFAFAYCDRVCLLALE